MTRIKGRGVDEVLCSVCNEFREIDLLLVAATPRSPIDTVLAELTKVRRALAQAKDGGSTLVTDMRSMIGQANEQFELFINALIDPAKDGPRIFSFEPVERSRFNLSRFTTQKYRPHTVVRTLSRSAAGTHWFGRSGCLRNRTRVRLVKEVRALPEVPVHHLEPSTPP